MMVDFKMVGEVSKIKWKSWPTGTPPDLPIFIGDVAEVEFHYDVTLNGNTSEKVENVKFSTTISGLKWSSETITRSSNLPTDPGKYIVGTYPDLEVAQQDFISPWENSQLEFQQNDQSIITLKLKEKNKTCTGIIESFGYIGDNSCAFVIE